MTGIQKTLVAIAAFIALGVGTFVYFVTQWDSAKATSIGFSMPRPPISVPEKSRGLGQSPSPALSVRTSA